MLKVPSSNPGGNFPFFFIFSFELYISTLFYFGVVYFTIEFERKKKKGSSNYGQLFPKIVHQKIIIVFEMQYSFCQTLNAIQTNIKESKAFKRINLRLRWKEWKNVQICCQFLEESDYSVVHICTLQENMHYTIVRLFQKLTTNLDMFSLFSSQP